MPSTNHSRRELSAHLAVLDAQESPAHGLVFVDDDLRVVLVDSWAPDNDERTFNCVVAAKQGGATGFFVGLRRSLVGTSNDETALDWLIGFANHLDLSLVEILRWK